MQPKTATIERVWLDGVRAKAGRTIPLKVLMRTYRGDEVVRTGGAGHPGHDAFEADAVALRVGHQDRPDVLPGGGQLGQADGGGREAHRTEVPTAARGPRLSPGGVHVPGVPGCGVTGIGFL